MRLKLISAAIVIVVLIFSVESFSQNFFNIKLTVADSGPLVPQTMTFGWHDSATICQDVALGEGPAPPVGFTFEVRLVPPRANLGESCYPALGFFKLDLRKWEIGVTIKDTFKLQVSNTGDPELVLPYTISWDPISNTNVTAIRIVEVGGEAKSVNMLTDNSIAINDPDVTTLRIFSTTLVGVEEIGGLPSDFQLNQNYPNPFNPSTTIHFAIPFKSDVEIAVYDVLGKKVKTLVSENLTASNYSVEWNGTTTNGISASSGIYFVRMNAVSENGNNVTQAIKVTLMK